MDPISTVSALTAVPPADALPRRFDLSQARDPGSATPLDPAVSVALSPEASDALRSDPKRRGFERDADTQTLVYRVTDTLSGEVVIQIPDEVVLKARAYVRQPNPPPGERIEKIA